MPGIFGFVAFKGEFTAAEAELGQMLKATTTLPTFQHATFKKNNVYYGYSQPRLVFNNVQYCASKENVTVVFDGELFNQDELPGKCVPLRKWVFL